MSLTIHLETEEGVEVVPPIIDWTHDFMFLVERMVYHTDEHYCCLRFITQYDWTAFNHLQMDTLIRELERIRSGVTDPKENSILDQIVEMAKLNKEEGGYIMWFRGE